MISDKTFPVDELHDIFAENDTAFTMPITEQARRQGFTLNQYITKMATLGTVAYERDYENGKLKGVVIGYTDNLPDDLGSYITQVVVDSAYRKQGVCSRLLREYIEFCRAKGINYIWLTTGQENIAAQGAYKKAGFVIVPCDRERTVKFKLVL